MPETLTPGKTYGDTQKLEGIKREGGTFGELVQKNPAGRPAAGPVVPVTPVVNTEQQAPEPEVPAEHQGLMEDYARALKAAQQWGQMAQAADAGPWVQFYAQTAQQQAEEAAIALKSQTPTWL
uniref:Uncharacterized protein n=1 Tax=viral metagenome TaxID=1070528 RepID=A0A6M3KCH5_9ZZZZ